jgi:hypothetical protein
VGQDSHRLRAEAVIRLDAAEQLLTYALLGYLTLDLAALGATRLVGRARKLLEAAA